MESNELGTTVVSWYYEAIGDDFGAARAARARLKRCNSLTDALAISETHSLNQRLLKLGEKPRADQLSLIAVSFANIKGVQGKKIATQFGRLLDKDGTRILSDTRFQSLIRIRERYELIRPLRRAFGVLGNKIECNGYQLAIDLYYWTDEVRNQWCFQYYGADFTNDKKMENS